MSYRAPPLPTSQRLRETEDLIARKATDITRWSEFGSLAAQWDIRAAVAAEWIPAGTRVLDVGCGAMTLGSLLKPGCVYFPADVVERRIGCFVVDLNCRQFPAGSYDWVSFLGVLEYVHEIGWPLRKACEVAPRMLVTYCTNSSGDISVRRGMGWVNDFTRSGFEAEVALAGWTIDRADVIKRGPTNIQIMYACSQSRQKTI